MRVIGLVLGLLATPVMAADQFDLICKGSVKERISATPERTEQRYRVDLVAKSWCWGDCASVRPIQAVEPGKIVFEERNPDFERDSRVKHWVDRTTGAWEDFYYISGPRVGRVYTPGLWHEASGTCHTAEFSGFPATKF